MMGTEDVEVRLSLAETYVLLAVLDCLAARGPVDTPQRLTVRIDQREIYGNPVSAMCERMAGLLQRRIHSTRTGHAPGTATPHSDAAALRSALFALEQERDDAVDLGLRTSLLAATAEHPVALDAGDVAATVQVLRTAGIHDRDVPAPDRLRLAAASAARVANNRARGAGPLRPAPALRRTDDPRRPPTTENLRASPSATSPTAAHRRCFCRAAADIPARRRRARRPDPPATPGRDIVMLSFAAACPA